VALRRAPFVNQHQQRHHRLALKHWVPVQETRYVEITHREGGVVIDSGGDIPAQLCEVVQHRWKADNGAEVVTSQLHHVYIVNLQYQTATTQLYADISVKHSHRHTVTHTSINSRDNCMLQTVMRLKLCWTMHSVLLFCY